jgi:hypothetical protein
VNILSIATRNVRRAPLGRAAKRKPAAAKSIAAQPVQPWPRRLLWALDTALGWFPITPLGMLMAGVLWAVVRFNAGENIDLIVATVGIGGLLICLVDAPLVLAAGIWLRCRGLFRSGAMPGELETGVSVATPFRLTWISWAPLFEFDISWEQPAGFEAWFEDDLLGRTEHVRPRTRGRFDAIVRRITIRDALGLARVRFRVAAPLAMRCVPGKAAITRLPLSEQFRPGDVIGQPTGPRNGDPVEIRKYVPGDPLKLLIWSIYARTGELVVRIPERPVSPFITTLAYFVAAEGDDASASIAWTSLERGSLGHDVTFMAEGAAEPAGSPALALDQIVRSAEHRQHGGNGLEPFLTRGEAAGTSATILFVSPVAGAWLDRVCAAVACHRGPFRAVIGIDRTMEPAESARHRRERARHLRVRGGRDEIISVRDRLRNAGVVVVVVDLATGMEWNPNEIEGQDDVRDA